MAVRAIDSAPIIARFFAVKLFLSRLKFLENLSDLHNQTRLLSDRADRIALLVGRYNSELEQKQQLIAALKAELEKIQGLTSTFLALGPVSPSS